MPGEGSGRGEAGERAAPGGRWRLPPCPRLPPESGLLVSTICVPAAYLENKYLPVGDYWGDSVGKGERDIAKTFRALKVIIVVFCFFFFPSFPHSFEVGYFYEENSAHITKGGCQGV